MVGGELRKVAPLRWDGMNTGSSQPERAALVFARRRWIFHPLTVVGASLLAAWLFALLVTARFEGEFRAFLLLYFLPVGVPFVAFLFDRAQHWNEVGIVRWGIDLSVVGLSLARSLVMIPFISGHALFLTYALLTARSWVTRILAWIVMCQVIYLKLFLWHDMTLWGGMALGCLAAFCFRRAGKWKAQAEAVA
jgi:hypothetical protein